MPLSNQDLATKLDGLVTKWIGREDEMLAWLAGTPTGGPGGDGLYPMTSPAGVVVYVPCPDRAFNFKRTAPTGTVPTSAVTMPLFHKVSRRRDITDFVDKSLYASLYNRTATTPPVNSLGQDSVSAALAEIPGFGRLEYPEGQYPDAGGRTRTTGGLDIIGAGDMGAEIVLTSATAHWLTIGDGSATPEGGLVAEIGFNTGPTRVAGAIVRLRRVERFDMERSRCAGQYRIVQVDDGSAIVRLSRIHNINPTAHSVSADGALVQCNDGGEVYWDDCYNQGNPAAQPTCAVRIKKTGYVKMTGGGAIASGTCLLVDPGSGEVAENVECVTVSWDTSSGYGAAYVPTGSGQVNRVMNTTLWTCTNGLAGRKFGGAGGTIKSVQDTGGQSFQNAQQGVHVAAGAAGLQFIGLEALGNSFGSPGVWDVAQVDNGVQGVAFLLGKYGPGEGLNTPGRYGISFGTGCDDIRVIAPDTSGNTYGGFLNNSASTMTKHAIFLGTGY